MTLRRSPLMAKRSANDDLYLLLSVALMFNSRRPREHPSQTVLHNFLDQLCLLCDYDCDGQTVCSLAPAEHEDGIDYWLASPKVDHDDTLEHLQWIFQTLKERLMLDHLTWKQVMIEIRTCSLQRSQTRVENYIANLSYRIDGGLHDVGEDEQARKALIADLRREFDDQQDRADLCDKANAFDNTSLGARLRQARLPDSEREPWRSIRHYIGRLAAWHKAAKTVVYAAKMHPEYVTKASARAIPTPRVLLSESKKLQIARKNVRLDDALRRLCERQSPADFRMSLSEAGGLPPEMLNDRFTKLMKLRPKTFKQHAEVTVADHFLKHGLAFLNDDRYIGCSKPSCYGCKWYLQVHPLQLEVRPCHNKPWMKWCYPLPPEDHTGWEDVQWTKTKADFLARVVEDIQETSLSGISIRRAKLHDSTTGMSGSFRSLCITSCGSKNSAAIEP